MVKRYVTLRPLMPRATSDLALTFRRMGELLRKGPERGRVHFRFVDGLGREAWTLELDAKGPQVREGRAGKPALELVTRTETWSKIAEGTLSPLEAFLAGKLRVRGDVEMAKRIVRQLAASDGEVDICG